MVTSPVTVSAFLPPVVAALVERGVRVDVASAATPEGFLLPGATLHSIPADRSGNPVHVVRAALAAARLVRQLRPDFILCATPVASLLGTVVGRLLRVPHVVHLAWGLRSESLQGLARIVVGWAERVTVRLAHLNLANSPSLKAKIIEADRGVADRVECLGAGSSHGVDLSRFNFEPPEDRPVPVMGFVGRVRTDKGVEELLDACDELQAGGDKFSLVVVGALEEPRLEARLASSSYVDHRPHTDDVPGLMREIDVLVLPSWREGFPNVVLEAAATGRPVITTDATGAVDSVRPGETGIVVPARQVAPLADAMRRLLHDPEERARMGVTGRAWVEQDFPSDIVCRRLVSRLLDEARSC